MLACFLVAVWLLCGACLRSRFAVFDRIYLPTAVIAGFVGLLSLQVINRLTSEPVESLTIATTQLKDWPAILIAIVFAGMLLPRAKAPWKQSVRAVGREVLMVWIIILGQTAIGLWVTWWLVQPFYDVPVSFAMLLETAFAGGHGTANAMGQVFKSPQINFPEGLDLGLLLATVGLVYGTVSGILWINLAVRWGIVTRATEPAEADEWSAQKAEANKTSSAISEERQSRRHFARGMEPLLVQALWLILAFSIGVALHRGVQFATQQIDAWQVDANERSSVLAQTPRVSGDEAERLMQSKLSFEGILGGFPLFIYTLFGGLLVRKILKTLGGGALIDERLVASWTSMAMDVLVVAAIATLNLAAVAELIVPFAVLAIAGMIWTAVCLLVLSRWILPKSHWFQLGLINYGMSTGVTATGFILLRIVDPELKTEAAKEYAMAAPFSAPFIGGGILTIALPLLVLEQVPIAYSTLALTAIVIALTCLALYVAARTSEPAGRS